MLKIFSLLLLCLFAYESNSQIPIPEAGSCADSPSIPDFDATIVILIICQLCFGLSEYSK